MRVIIYAAGVSRRLKTITGSGLKGLIKLGSKRIIEYQLDWIVGLSISEVILVLGLEHQQYKDVLGNSYKGMPIIYVYNPDYKDKGNMLSLWHARKYCNTDILFTTSDLICDSADITKFNNSKDDNKILIDQQNKELFHDSDPVKVSITNNKISSIQKDKHKLESVDGVAVGLYKFCEKGIENIIHSIEKKIELGNDNLSLYCAIDNVLTEFNVVPIYADKCQWIDIDTPEDLEKAQKLNCN